MYPFILFAAFVISVPFLEDRPVSGVWTSFHPSASKCIEHSFYFKDKHTLIEAYNFRATTKQDLDEIYGCEGKILVSLMTIWDYKLQYGKLKRVLKARSLKVTGSSYIDEWADKRLCGSDLWKAGSWVLCAHDDLKDIFRLNPLGGNVNYKTLKDILVLGNNPNQSFFFSKNTRSYLHHIEY